MARGRLKLSLVILEVTVVMAIAVDMVVMDTAVDMEDMDMAVDTMARGKLKLSQDTLEDMAGMVVGMDMGVMDMVDMAIMVNFFKSFSYYIFIIWPEDISKNKINFTNPHQQ